MSTAEIRRRAEVAAHYGPFQRFMYAIGLVRITTWYERGLRKGPTHYYADFSRLPETGVKYGETA